MILWLAGAALAASFDGGVLAGAALSMERSEREAKVRPAFGFSVGLVPVRPVRTEVQLLSAGVSVPQGVAVTVSTWWADVALLGGISPRLISAKTWKLDLDMLVGPDLRFTRTAVGIYDDAGFHLTVGPRLALAAGPAVQLWKLRVGLRGEGFLPRGHHGLVLLSVALSP